MTGVFIPIYFINIYLPLVSIGWRFLALSISILKRSSTNCILTVRRPQLGSSIAICCSLCSKWYWWISSHVSIPCSNSKCSICFRIAGLFVSFFSSPCLKNPTRIFRVSCRFKKKVGGLFLWKEKNNSTVFYLCLFCKSDDDDQQVPLFWWFSRKFEPSTSITHDDKYTYSDWWWW